MFKTFDTIALRLSQALAVLAGAALVAMTLLACANMLLRGVWVPIKGTFEIMGFLGAVVASFSLASTQLAKGHIAVNVLQGLFPQPVERLVDALGRLASAAFFGLMAVKTAEWSLFLVDTGELSETLRFPYWPFTLAVALGCAVLALVLVADAAGSLAGMRATDEAES